MLADTFFEQTGWKGRSDEELCQNGNIAGKVYEHDFDLNDENFRKYLKSRGICSFENLEKCGDGFKKLEEHVDFLTNWNEDRVLSDDKLARSITGVPFDAPARKTFLWIWKSLRGKIQQAWELYSNNEVF